MQKTDEIEAANEAGSVPFYNLLKETQNGTLCSNNTIVPFYVTHVKNT